MAVRKHTFLLGAFLLFVSLAISTLLISGTAEAAPGKINYQGRLTNSAGTPMADGQYNMKFRIYSAASGGTLLWSETRETTTRVTVTNGQFNVQLGEVTAITDSVFAANTTYFEVELPTPATATCSTASCGAYTEGAMTPRQPVASAAYAMQANKAFDAQRISGYSVTEIARIDEYNIFSNMNNFHGDVTVGSTNSATKFIIRDTLSANLFTADTSGMIVKVGTTSAASLANVRLLTTSAEFTGTVRVGTATDGVDISGANGILLSGTARGSRVATLSPEYAGATFAGDGSSNNGALSSDFCSPTSLLAINAASCVPAVAGDRAHNYYQWTVSLGSAQDYDIYVRYQIPSNYSSGSMSNFKIWGHAANGTNGVVRASMYTDASATACFTSSDIVTQNDLWESVTVATPLGGCTIAANDYVTFKLRLEANATSVRVGDMSFSYRSTF